LILIADDSPIIQRRAQQILQEEGFEVLTVSNGVAAVKKLPVMQPVLVLADVSMPGKDGYEVCEFVKTSAGLRHVPVLLVGSDLEPYDEQRGARVRADGIIKKPFAPHDLIAMVRRFATPEEAPLSQPTADERPVAASAAAALAVPFESRAASSQKATGGGREGEIPSTGAAPPWQVADDVTSNIGQQPDERPEITLGSFPELSGVPSVPFSGFVLGPPSESSSEPAPDGTPEPALAAPETSKEIGGPREVEELILPPQLVDLTAQESLPEAGPVFAELISQPAMAPEPDLIAAESPRAAEESNAREPGEPILDPQLVVVTAAEILPEPAPLIAGPVPEAALEISPEPSTAALETLPEVEELNPTPPNLDASGSPKPAREPALVATEPTPEPVPAAPPEPASVSPEAGQDSGDLISMPPALEPLAALDAEWIFKVVHKVVTRMAPAVLAPEQVEEIARMLSREIMSELGGRGDQTDCPHRRPPFH